MSPASSFLEVMIHTSTSIFLASTLVSSIFICTLVCTIFSPHLSPALSFVFECSPCTLSYIDFPQSFSHPLFLRTSFLHFSLYITLSHIPPLNYCLLLCLFMPLWFKQSYDFLMLNSPLWLYPPSTSVNLSRTPSSSILVCTWVTLYTVADRKSESAV